MLHNTLIYMATDTAVLSLHTGGGGNAQVLAELPAQGIAVDALTCTCDGKAETVPSILSAEHCLLAVDCDVACTLDPGAVFSCVQAYRPCAADTEYGSKQQPCVSAKDCAVDLRCVAPASGALGLCLGGTNGEVCYGPATALTDLLCTQLRSATGPLQRGWYRRTLR